MVELVDIMNDAVGRVSELAARSGIDLATLDTAEAAEPLRVDGDRRQLASAVGNILENAVKYSERGDVVHVAVRRADDLGEIVVADEGAGIPRQDLDRVFERFYRVDRARSRRTGGTGLGLSIVRHVAQAHGGSISVDSVEGQGATFVLRLPLAIDPDETSVQAAEPATEREGIA